MQLDVVLLHKSFRHGDPKMIHMICTLDIMVNITGFEQDIVDAAIIDCFAHVTFVVCGQSYRPTEQIRQLFAVVV